MPSVKRSLSLGEEVQKRRRVKQSNKTTTLRDLVTVLKGQIEKWFQRGKFRVSDCKTEISELKQLFRAKMMPPELFVLNLYLKWKDLLRLIDINHPIINCMFLMPDKYKYFFMLASSSARITALEPLKIEVDRKASFFENFGNICLSLKKNGKLGMCDMLQYVRVTFKNEPAIDAGGPTREWASCILNECFKTFFRMNTETGILWPKENLDALQLQVLGTLFGFILLNRCQFPEVLPIAFFKQLRGTPLVLDDLQELSPTVHKNLCRLLKMENPEDAFVELNDGTPVTRANVTEYVKDFVQNYTKQLAYFNTAFHRFFPPEVLQRYTLAELQQNCCENTVLDMHNVERDTCYVGYDAKDPPIRMFWEIVHNLSHAKQQRLYTCLTGNSRPGRKWYKYSHLTINRTSCVFPMAHTCFSTLDLPPCQCKQELSEKIAHLLICDKYTDC